MRTSRKTSRLSDQDKAAWRLEIQRRRQPGGSVPRRKARYKRMPPLRDLRFRGGSV